ADRAAQIVRSLPHVWESREIVVPEIADDYPAALREAVRKVLVFLCRKIEAAEDRVPGEIPAYFQLGADFTPEKDDTDMLDVIAGFLAE
ncbi:MAG: hypothetical protein J6Q17_06670, partial [Clostridia bacterium]|nr:hypothetical protein [Clostridia bacterium]